MKLGILVSGGDAPGVNAVIYGAHTAAKVAGAELVGISGGFKGVLDGRIKPLEALNPELIHVAGSILPTGRFEAFREEAARLQVRSALEENGIEGLVVAGGNGSLAGARDLADMGYPVIGVPTTVDGDVFSTESAVGFATAVQVVTRALAALHSTAAAYPGRIFLLETLGGKRGYLALVAGLAGAADVIVIPETAPTIDAVARKMEMVLAQKGSAVGVVCEGANPAWKSGDQNYIVDLGDRIQKHTGVRARYSVAGYGLRGEHPTYEDCLLGRWCGQAAVTALTEGKTGLVTGTAKGRYGLYLLDPCTGGFDAGYWLDMARQNRVLPE